MTDKVSSTAVPCSRLTWPRIVAYIVEGICLGVVWGALRCIISVELVTYWGRAYYQTKPTSENFDLHIMIVAGGVLGFLFGCAVVVVAFDRKRPIRLGGLAVWAVVASLGLLALDAVLALTSPPTHGVFPIAPDILFLAAGFIIPRILTR